MKMLGALLLSSAIACAAVVVGGAIALADYWIFVTSESGSRFYVGQTIEINQDVAEFDLMIVHDEPEEIERGIIFDRSISAALLDCTTGDTFLSTGSIFMETAKVAYSPDLNFQPLATYSPSHPIRLVVCSS